MVDARAVKSYFMRLQDQICAALEAECGDHRFREDLWQRPEGGGGRTRVMEGGEVLEKAGVNFSHVTGEKLPASSSAKRPDLANRPFEAMGVSLVIHPANPRVPTVHMNVRFFLATSPGADPIWWFGGGFDLTPYYPELEDVHHWHQNARQACLTYAPDAYTQFKGWCDRYFYLKHRRETRGVGGLFFDDLNEGGFARNFEFIQSVGNRFTPGYLPILVRRKNQPFGQRERDFQCYRRGRYVEFNLLYDRGTLFGLQTGGRTESILMSLPPVVTYKYNWEPKEGSPEAELAKYLVPRDWLIEPHQT